MSPALSQASHRGLQHDDPETWLNIEEDLVGAGVDAASVSSEHDLIKRFVDNVWAGGDTNDDDSRAQSAEFEENGPDDHSDGQNEKVGKSKGDAASTQGSKGRINDLQETNSRPPTPKIRSVEDSDPSIDFESKDVIRDSEYQNLWDRVIGDRELIRSRGVSAYKRVEALLLCWDQSCSDMSTETEVEDLKTVFETRFGYHTTVEHLNPQSIRRIVQMQLNAKVAIFLDSHDGPDTLLIIYYTVHGEPRGDPGDLYLYGLVSILSNLIFFH